MDPGERNPLNRWTHQLWQALALIAFLPVIVALAIRLIERLMPIVGASFALLLLVRWIVFAIRRKREWSDW